MSTPHNAGSEDSADALLETILKQAGLPDAPIDLDSATLPRLECPACHGSEVLPIVYGFDLSTTLSDQALQGLLVLGGCCIHPEVWRCSSCRHEWGNIFDQEMRYAYRVKLAWIEKHYVPLSDEARRAKYKEMEEELIELRAQRAEREKDRVPLLVQTVQNSKQMEERKAAIQALADMGPQGKGATFLVGLLTDPDGQIPWRVLEAIDFMPDWTPQILQVLTTALKDPSKKIRSRSLDMLRRLGSAAQPALPAIKEALADEDSHVRSHAEEAIRDCSLLADDE